MITAKQVTEKLDYNPATGEFVWKRTLGTSIAGRVAGQVSSWGYIRIPLFGRKHSAHRLVWLLEHGALPDMQIDHIDGNKKNNSIGNLRLVTPSLNQLCNTKPRSNNVTGFVGVSPDRGGRFKSQIKLDGKSYFLGSFRSAGEAHAAYSSARAAHLAAHGIQAPAKQGDSA